MLLNPFPHLLFYSFYAPLLLRLILGLVFIEFGYSKLTKEKSSKSDFFEKIGLKPGKTYVLVFAIIELLAGAMLVVGLYTQIASLIASLIIIGTLVIKKKHPAILKSEARYYFVILVIALTLLITGAGAYAIDLPL